MDNWSGEPHPVKTQERWDRDIRKDLESGVNEALIEAHYMLEAEGLLVSEVA
jgi:hypothetical protein